jgi:hypothetical protein
MVGNEDPRTVLNNATDAVHSAVEAVQSTTESIAEAIEGNRQPGSVFNQVARIAREAPLRSLGLAFLAGWIIARRR